jgi:hypothetical protein
LCCSIATRAEQAVNLQHIRPAATALTKESAPMYGKLVKCFGLSLTLLGSTICAGEHPWRPSLGRPVAVVPTETTMSHSVAATVLARPVAISEEPAAGADRLHSDPGPLVPASYNPAEGVPGGTVVRAQAPDPGGPPLSLGSPASPAEQYNCGVANQPPPAATGFWDKCKGVFVSVNPFAAEGGHHPFQSDHAFDDFISPVSNPFYLEDPRSLTEARPIFMYQATSTHNSIFHGGDIEFFGVQGRLAFTDRFSIVVNKFGGIAMEPHNATEDFQPHSGFAEINIGPKYTFIRNESCGTLVAGGLTFEIPAGDNQVIQDTGSLSLVPYLSVGQRFGHTKFGTFHALGTLAYEVAVDGERSDKLVTALHLDFDYGDAHKIYPLIELNWFYYTSNGSVRNITFEGDDLFNAGARHVSGQSDLSLALGARYKLNEMIQFGGAVEVPLSSSNRLMDYRLTFDMIFRY